jgi:hypothetical protein
LRWTKIIIRYNIGGAREIISGLLHDLPTHAGRFTSLLPPPVAYYRYQTIGTYRYSPPCRYLPVPSLPVFSTLPAPVFIVLQYPASGNKWFSESMSGYLGYRYLYPCGCPPAREPYPGYFTDKYPLREINHPTHTMPLSLKTYISGLH